MEMYDSNGNIIKGIAFKNIDLVPDFLTMSMQLTKFEKRLQDAVDIEDYENAAILRDKIIDLKKEMIK